MDYTNFLKNLFYEKVINISHIPEEFLKDKEFVIKMLEVAPCIYYVLDIQFTNNLEICMEAVKHSSKIYESLPNTLKVNRHIVAQAIKYCKEEFDVFFEDYNKQLLNDKTFLTACISNNPKFIFYLIKIKKQTLELFKLAVISDPLILNYFEAKQVCKKEYFELFNYTDMTLFFKFNIEIQKAIFDTYFAKVPENVKRRKIDQ